MPVKFSPLSLEHIQDIWLYSADNWGEERADAYVNGLFDLLETLPAKTHLWRTVPRDSLRGTLCVPYRDHIVFFRQFPSHALGIIAVLHQRQDLPNHLKDLSSDW